MANIGDLVVHLDANTTGLERGLDRGQESLQRVNRGMQTTMGIARRLTGVLGAIGVGLSLRSVVTQFADFEQGMSNVGAVSGATAKELDRLDESALRAAASTRFNPAQTTQALYALASSGQAAQEQIATLPNVLNLAEAGQADLGQSTELLTSTLSQFGLEAEQSQRVADVFVASIGASALNVNRLQVAFRNAAPTAAAMGQSLEQTTAAVGILTTAFGNGERAGTGFRAILNELPDNADDLGISVKDASGNFVGLVSVLRQLEERGVASSKIVEMFGAEAGPALAALLSQGSEALATMESRMVSTGQAAETAGKQLDTLRGDLDALASSVDVAFVEIGRSQGGVMRTATQTVTNLVRLWSGYGDTLGESRESTEAISAAIEALALVISGRLLVALTSSAAAKAVSTKASIDNARAEAVAAQATTRRTGAELASAKAMLSSIRLEEQATRGTSAHAFALNALSAARTRATTAAGLHNAATSASAAAMTRASAAARGLSAAMALVGGPLGVAALAAWGIYSFREELGLVPKQAKSVAENVNEITRSLEGMSGAMLDVQVAAFGAELVQIELQAERLQTRIESLQKAANDPASFGQGQQGDITAGLASAQAEQEGLTNRAKGIEEAINGLDRFRRSTDEVSSGLGETYDKLVPTNEQAGKLGEKIKPVNEALGGAKTAVDTFASAATSAARQMASIAQSRDPRYGLDPDEGTASSRARARFEASANRIGDPNVINLGGNASANRTWSTAAYDAAGSVPGMGMGRSASEAMQTADNRSVKRLGEVVLAKEGGGKINVQANADELTRFVTDLFSGTAASA